MTLSVAWIRQFGSSKELVMASDSRLRLYGAWDACPKIFPLPRGDSAISFCGATSDAYPFILQLLTSVSLHRASMNRSLDLSRARGHFLRTLNSMRNAMEKDRNQPVAAEARFIIAGYCWRSAQFRLWQFRYNNTLRTYVHSNHKSLSGMANKPVVAIGDPNYTAQQIASRSHNRTQLDFDVQREFYARLVKLIIALGTQSRPGLDMEPLEVLVEMIRTNVSPHIGGAPQLIKVYSYSKVQPFGCFWPWDDGIPHRSLMGRPLMDYEEFDVPFINCQTLNSTDDGKANTVPDMHRSDIVQIESGR
jgi:hypothetical protein